MDMKSVEQKWQQRWAKEKSNVFNKKNIDKKQYILEMFSYPSGAKLHVGHWYNYGPTDSYARFKKMQGYEVFQPMGFDAFGLPAENYAIKTGIHPKDSTEKNIATMEEQLKAMGAMFDWSAEIRTCEEDYYRWTQWLFLKLYENKLAYRKESPVNWCPNCQTVLANEQVVDGKCERCGTEVLKKNMTQWFFKITEYAEELLRDLDKLDWPEKTKAMQKNWIGKSVGAEVEFAIVDSDKSFKVFTTRVDTIFGVSYVVLAPEHPLVKEITTEGQKEVVDKYVYETLKSSEIDRLSSTKEKSGVFTGAYAINPVNDKKVPIYIGDYVLYTYGTGAVMGVPAHDERDFAFAKKYNLPITKVIESKGEETVLPYCDDGYVVNSVEFDGLYGDEARDKIIKSLAVKGKGQKKVNYRLRDWSVSRQRYWGAPIPIVYCDKCGVVPVPYKDLPVKLPYNVEFRPDGKSPLAKNEEFVHTKCPICGGDAMRDPDTMDTFVCSSWYYLRYPDAKNTKEPFNPEIINKMLPVDKYVGGPEHSCGHLLYSRFITKALRDMGYLNFDEPFKSLVHQGVILGPDGNRMSKSKGNVISPNDYVEKYGSDIFRLYLMFGFSYIEGGPWTDDGIKSIAKFTERIERIVIKANELPKNNNDSMTSDEKELNFVLNNTIKSVTKDMGNFSFNTAIARLMELVNAMYKYDNLEKTKNNDFFKEVAKKLLLLIAPCAPHFAEELWEMLGNKTSIFIEEYPLVDESALVLDEIEYGIQINSKIRGKMVLSKSLTDDEIKEIVVKDGVIAPQLEGKDVKKIIIIRDRLINIIAQ